MSQSEMESKSTGSESELEVVERGEGWFKVQHRQGGNICTIMDTFAEMFSRMEISPANPLFFHMIRWVRKNYLNGPESLGLL